MKLKAGDSSLQHSFIKTSRRGIVGLKIVLPAVLVLILMVMIFWPHINEHLLSKKVDAEVINTVQKKFAQKQGLTNQAKNIHFDGVDSHQQPYVLVANEGVEYENNRSKLKMPVLTIHLNSGEIVTLSSEKSVYDRKKQLLELIGNVVLTHSTGYEFTTPHAWANLADSSAYGEDPVTGVGPQGDIFAQMGFLLTEKGDKIKFMGRPELKIFEGTK